MTTIFLICTVIGGTIMVVQFVMSLVGMGSEALHIDLPGGMDTGLHADTGFDVHTDFDVHGGLDHGGGHVGHTDHVDSSWMFKVLSVRTVVAALAFFGLAGLSAQSMEAAPWQQLAVAVAAGAGAMAGVYWLMRWLTSMQAEGTPRIERAIGRHGTVYTSIPAGDSGAGKIQLNLQNRTMEYLAMTPGQALRPGAKVVVTDVVSSNTLQVEPVLDSERNSHA